MTDNKRGGKRAGAGRKVANTRQITLRLPVDYIERLTANGDSVQTAILNLLKKAVDNQTNS